MFDRINEYEFRELAGNLGPGFSHCPRAAEIYKEHLLPRFLKYATENNFDIRTWDRRTSSEPFQQTLEATVSKWIRQDESRYIIHHDKLYVSFCFPKDIGGIPKNINKRDGWLSGFGRDLFRYFVYTIDLDDLLRARSYYLDQSEDRDHNVLMACAISAIFGFGLATSLFK